MADLFGRIVLGREDVEKELDEKSKARKLCALAKLEDVNPETWEKRFEGRAGCYRLAKNVAPILNPTGFGAWIESFGVDVSHDLFAVLKPYCPEMNSEDEVPAECANLFCEIIRQAASHVRPDAKINVPEELSGFEIDPPRTIKDLEIIVGRLGVMDLKSVRKLKLDPYDIDEKIDHKEGALLEKININIARYYKVIKSEFLKHEKLGRKKFHLVAAEMNDRYQSLSKNRNLTQEQIFDALVDWLERHVPKASRTSCEIIVSFFVQDCEVFDELP